MIVHLTFKEIESIADNINSNYNPERLLKPQPIDIYDLADSIDASISICSIRDNHTIKGAAIFEECSFPVYVWNEEMQSVSIEKREFKPRTIIIDHPLAPCQKFKEKLSDNFTMAHECFHLVKHEYYYKNLNAGIHQDTSLTLSSLQENELERQANYGAACILMPRKVVLSEVEALTEGVLLKDTLERNNEIEKMAGRFGVNFSPMKYRLINLGLMPPEKEKGLKLFKD